MTLRTFLALAGMLSACASSDPIGEGAGGERNEGGATDGGSPSEGGEAPIGGAGGDGPSEGGSGGGSLPTCGDGTVDAIEECDDGNAAPSDGCGSDCAIECEPEATKNPADGHCYRVFTTALSWDEARMQCADWGGAPGLGFLVSITDGVEQAFVAPLVSVNSWIGAGDAVAEGVYEWIDGTPWTYDLWAPGEPNDTTVEDCVFMRADGTWDDHDCLELWPAYVCERRGAGTF